MQQEYRIYLYSSHVVYNIHKQKHCCPWSDIIVFHPIITLYQQTGPFYQENSGQIWIHRSSFRNVKPNPRQISDRPTVKRIWIRLHRMFYVFLRNPIFKSKPLLHNMHNQLAHQVRHAVTFSTKMFNPYILIHTIKFNIQITSHAKQLRQQKSRNLVLK